MVIRIGSFLIWKNPSNFLYKIRIGSCLMISKSLLFLEYSQEKDYLQQYKKVLVGLVIKQGRT